MLPYHKQMLVEVVEEDSLLVTACGLRVDKIVARFVLSPFISFLFLF